MKNEIKCFSEGKWYNTLKNEKIVSAMKKYPYQRNIIKLSDSSFKFCFSGIMVLDNWIVIVFPKSYKIPDNVETQKNEAKILLKVLLKYKQEKAAEWEELQVRSGIEKGTSSSIVEAINILEDYRDYGILDRRHKIRTQRKAGRIEWNMTVRKTNPLFSHNQPVYINPIMVSNVKTRDELIQRIHRALLSELIQYWGWIFDDIADLNSEKWTCTKEEAIDILSAELRQCFVQREISLIKNMRKYLQQQNGNNKKTCHDLMITPDFQWIWENICGVVLGNKFDQMKKDIPQPDLHSDKINKFMQQRPDLICIRDKTGYILDAKYYDYKKTFPGWPDIVKQLFYHLTIKEGLGKESKYIGVSWNINALLLPESDPMTNVQYLGYIDVKNIESFDEVEVYSLNTKMMMEAYILRNKMEKIRKQIFDKINYYKTSAYDIYNFYKM